MVACAEPSLAARFEAKRLGIAMAAIMPIIATTIKSSIREKPSWRFVFISYSCSLEKVVNVSRANGLRPYDVCRAEREVSRVSLTRAVPLGVPDKLLRKAKEFEGIGQ